MRHSLAIFILIILAFGCAKPVKEAQKGILFKDDLAFLREQTGVAVLSDETGQAQVAVNPDLQGRVMTSRAEGPEGASFGWINRELLASKQNNPHMNAFGGEDRFWLGPEGGQFSIFFKKWDPFDLDHWFTPPPINEGAFDVIEQTGRSIQLRKKIHLLNYTGTTFDLEVNRRVSLLDGEKVKMFGLEIPPGAKWVGFESTNEITNTGAEAWKKETGLLSVWILGMFNPSPQTTIVVPYTVGPESNLGPIVNDAYFGVVPSERLLTKQGVVYFKGDGQYRSKIGIPPRRAKPFLGSYDAASKTLTIVHVSLPPGATDYVNSMWEIQKNPYGGDAVNSYNDGPPAPGAKPLGPFYELESSSPAAALKPGESLVHCHATMHFRGNEAELDGIARRAFGVGIEEIKKAFQ
jgi:hypothetical protein